MLRATRVSLLLLGLCPVVARLAAQDVPTPIKAIPFEKLALPVPSGDGPFGYVPVSADRDVVLMMLRNGSYRQLDQYFDGLQRSAAQRIQYETEFSDAFMGFGKRDAALRRPLEAWRDSSPSSAHARVALAVWLLEQAWEARGTKYARDTPSANMSRMTSLAEQAAKEALAGLQLDRTHLVGWITMLHISQLAGGDRSIADEARRIHPASYIIPSTYMGQLEPRWGGSLAEMDAYAAEVMADRQLNPRLGMLRGASLEYQAMELTGSKKYDDAVRAMNRALEDGPEPGYYLERADAHYYRGDYLRALEDANRVLAFRHQLPHAQHLHAAIVLLAADSLSGNQRASALRQARDEFTALLPWDEDPAHTQEHLDWVNYSMQNCITDAQQCKSGGMRAGLPTTMGWEAKLIAGALGLILLFNFYRWAAGGFPVPRYIHFLVLLSAVVTGGAVYMANQQRGPLPPKVWLAVLAVPLGLYVLSIGLGGATWASQRRKQKEAEEAAARAVRAASRPVPFSRPPEAHR